MILETSEYIENHNRDEFIKNRFISSSYVKQQHVPKIRAISSYGLYPSLEIILPHLHIEESKSIFYTYKNHLTLTIPKEISYLKKAFQNSEYILSLDDDWDDMNSPKYELETWINTIKFVHNYATKTYDSLHKKIEVPKIYHGPNKSIDVLFENDNYSLLINIPFNSNTAIYYGRDTDGNNVKGELNILKFNHSLTPIPFK